MTMVLVDTGVLYAMADSDDAWHKPVKIFLEQMQDVLVVPITVLPEACYLLSSYLGPESERKLISSIVQGEIRIESLAKSDFRRILELLP
ncbi:MAG: type II toxin-antitoxin system VapC family toxin [Thermodesulfobacteriota bacterium]